jgi:hypothetical protein
MAARRFRRPRPSDEANDACFIIRDHSGHALVYRRKEARSTMGDKEKK